MDCFAEPVIGRRFAPTRWLAMTRGTPRHLSARRSPPAFSRGVFPQLRIAFAKQAAVAGAQLELSNRPARAAIDHEGREGATLAGKLLAPLPQRHQHRKDPAPLRRQHIFLICPPAAPPPPLPDPPLSHSAPP